MTSADLVTLGLSIFGVGVYFAMFFMILGGLLAGAIYLVRSYMGVGRG